MTLLVMNIFVSDRKFEHSFGGGGGILLAIYTSMVLRGVC